MTEISDLVSLKAFDNPDETRLFEKGRFEIVRIGGATLGRATYQPGWRWSLHVGPTVGASRCEVAHLGYVVSGLATAAFDDGRIFELSAGSLFHIPAIPHDSWVIGDEAYISLHLLGASDYAT
jgi:quercetin dioxygenase-like cupin family protein